MKITVLTENTSISKLYPSEHGLSLYIETNKHKILFDMGQSSLFAENASKMGIDLSLADIAILSHGHYDHGGGLAAFLEHNSKAPVYLSKFAFEPHYNASNKCIGLDPNMQNSDRLIFTDGITVIDDELTLFSSSTVKLRESINNSGLSVMTDGELVPEDFRHEQYLQISDKNKSILISGCSHIGILNITDHFRPDILVGGFHFMKLTPECEYLVKTAEKLLSYNTRFLTCHCTGIEQYKQLKSIMGEKLGYLSTGDVLDLKHF